MAQQGQRRAENALLTALACGATVESAARAAGLSERTVYRRLEDAEFARKLRDMRTAMVQRTTGMLTAASLESVKTLLTLQDSANPAAVRLQAARAVIDLAMRLRENADVLERLAVLEDRCAAATKPTS